MLQTTNPATTVASTSAEPIGADITEAGTPAKKAIHVPQSNLEAGLEMLSLDDDKEDSRQEEEALRNSLLLEKQGRGPADGGPTESNKGMNSQLDKIMRGESGEIRKFGDNSWMRDREDQRVGTIVSQLQEVEPKNGEGKLILGTVRIALKREPRI